MKREQTRVRSTDEGVNVKEIFNCSRCGGNHTRVLFKRFTEPIVFNGIVYAYWTLCPILKEPIIMAREVENDE